MKTLRVREQNIYIFLLISLIIFDFSVILSPPFILRMAVIVPFLFFAPGVLLLKLLKVSRIGFWEKLVYIFGLSIAFLMFCGLAANWIFPIIRIFRPLSLYPILYMCNVLFSIMLFFGYTRSSNIPSRFHVPKISLPSMYSLLPLVLFPVFGVFSALQVNNLGSSVFTTILLSTIALFVIFVTFLSQKIRQHIYPVSLFIISLSLLLMTSLRGWFVTGHDIQMEFYVFQLTKNHGLWDMNFYKDAYNACLSITILPTIFSVFLKIQDDYIYKVIFQIAFSFAPVLVYLFIKKYASNIVAFLATFYIIAFPTFFNDMPMLNRQEIGFIYFFLLLHVLFNDRLTEGKKIILAVVFGMSMVVSHYSTTYVAIGLLCFTYLLRKISLVHFVKRINFTLLKKIPLPLVANTFLTKPRVSGVVLIILVLFTFYWNSLLTKTSGDLTKTIASTFANMNSSFKEDTKSSDVSYSIFFPHAQSTKEFIADFTNKSKQIVKQNHLQDFYSQTETNSFKMQVIPPAISPLTWIGRLFAKLNVSSFDLNSTFRSLCAKGIQAIVFIGLFGLLFYKTKEKYPLDFILVCFTSMFFIFLMLLLPSLSINYGLLRLFEQMLVVLCLPAIIGNLILLSFLRQNHAIKIVAIFSAFFFLNVSGVISQFTGGYFPQMNFANKGIYYDSYYVHKAEIASSVWLASELPPDAVVQADGLAANRLITFGDINAVDVILPPLIQKSSYVYLGTTNISGKSIISVDRLLYITYPTTFLDDNKNLIYNNGSSRIYR